MIQMRFYLKPYLYKINHIQYISSTFPAMSLFNVTMPTF